MPGDLIVFPTAGEGDLVGDLCDGRIQVRVTKEKVSLILKHPNAERSVTVAFTRDQASTLAILLREAGLTIPGLRS